MTIYEGKTEKGTAFRLFPASGLAGSTQVLEVFGIRMGFDVQTEQSQTVLRGRRQVEVGGKKVNPCIPLTPEIAAWLAEEKTRAEEKKRTAAEVLRQEEEALRAGETLIPLSYAEGEYLSGYRVSGPGAKLLTDLGLAREIEGWGTHVTEHIVKILGERISYPAAVEYSRPRREQEARAEAERVAREEAAFAKAKATGRPVMLREFYTDCNSREESCNVDHVGIFAMPDGTIRQKRTHTW